MLPRGTPHRAGTELLRPSQQLDLRQPPQGRRVFRSHPEPDQGGSELASTSIICLARAPSGRLDGGPPLTRPWEGRRAPGDARLWERTREQHPGASAAFPMASSRPAARAPRSRRGCSVQVDRHYRLEVPQTGRHTAPPPRSSPCAHPSAAAGLTCGAGWALSRGAGPERPAGRALAPLDFPRPRPRPF